MAPAGPAGPVAPAGPAGPVAPAGPAGPVAPVATPASHGPKRPVRASMHTTVVPARLLLRPGMRTSPLSSTRKRSCVPPAPLTTKPPLAGTVADMSAACAAESSPHSTVSNTPGRTRYPPVRPSRAFFSLLMHSPSFSKTGWQAADAAAPTPP